MDIKDKLQAIVDGNDSAYQIQQFTGVSSSIIIRLRNHLRSIDNLSLKTAERLSEYYDYRMVSMEKMAFGQKQLPHFRHRLINRLQQLYEVQQKKAESSSMSDETALTVVIEQLFNDVLSDKVELGRLDKVYQAQLNDNKKPTKLS